MENKVKKGVKVVSKPRNYVVVAMIRSGKSSSAHQKNHKKKILDQIQEDSFVELYDEYDDGSY